MDSDWHEQAVNVIERLAREQDTVTAEDLRKHHEPPEHANQIGNVFQAAYKLKLIAPVGYRPSKDKSRKGGVLRVWALHESQKDRE